MGIRRRMFEQQFPQKALRFSDNARHHPLKTPESREIKRTGSSYNMKKEEGGSVEDLPQQLTPPTSSISMLYQTRFPPPKPA